MFMITVAGEKGAGTTTVACELARIIAKIRGKAGVYIAATEQQNSQAVMHLSAMWTARNRRTTAQHVIKLHLRRMRGLGPLDAYLQEAAGMPFVIDTRDALFTEENWNYSQQVSGKAEEAGVRAGGNGPVDWMHLNRLLREETIGKADALKIDLVETYKTSDARRGGRTIDAIQLRGDSQAARQAALVIEVTGGLASDEPRGIYVHADVSSSLTGVRERLPVISKPAHLTELRQTLAALFEVPLAALLRVADEDRDEWLRIFATEPPYTWDAAGRQVERDAADALYAEIAAAFKFAELAGADAVSQRIRIGLLRDHFGVFEMDVLERLPLKRLQDGLATLRPALQELEARKRLKARIFGLLRRAGLEGKSVDVITRRAEAFAINFNVLSEDELGEMSSEALQAGHDLLVGALFPTAEMGGEVAP